VGYGLFALLLVVLGPAIESLATSSVAAIAAIGHHYYLAAQWISWVLMVPVSTVTMKYFAFRSEGWLLRQVGRAYLIYLPAQGVNTLILWLAVRIAHLTPYVGQLLAIGVTTIMSYLGHKYFTFRTPEQQAD
jgi:putative flippase GtrA